MVINSILVAFEIEKWEMEIDKPGSLSDQNY